MARMTALIVVMFLFAAGADTAAAQSAFVSGTVFANIYSAGRYSTASPLVQDEDPSGTTVGGSFGIGTHIGTHLVVQVELAFPAELEHSFGPPRFLLPLPAPRVTSERTVEYRTRNGSILGGYRTGTRGRVSAALLGGLMFFQERTRMVSQTIPPPPSSPLPFDSTYRAYRMAPVFGFDVTVTAFSHLSVVPQMRVWKSSSGAGAIGLWPGVGVRWTF